MESSFFPPQHSAVRDQPRRFQMPLICNTSTTVDHFGLQTPTTPSSSMEHHYPEYFDSSPLDLNQLTVSLSDISPQSTSPPSPHHKGLPFPVIHHLELNPIPTSTYSTPHNFGLGLTGVDTSDECGGLGPSLAALEVDEQRDITYSPTSCDLLPSAVGEGRDSQSLPQQALPIIDTPIRTPPPSRHSSLSPSPPSTSYCRLPPSPSSPLGKKTRSPVSRALVLPKEKNDSLDSVPSHKRHRQAGAKVDCVKNASDIYAVHINNGPLSKATLNDKYIRILTPIPPPSFLPPLDDRPRLYFKSEQSTRRDFLWPPALWEVLATPEGEVVNCLTPHPSHVGSYTFFHFKPGSFYFDPNMGLPIGDNDWWKFQSCEVKHSSGERWSPDSKRPARTIHHHANCRYRTTELGRLANTILDTFPPTERRGKKEGRSESGSP